MQLITKLQCKHASYCDNVKIKSKNIYVTRSKYIDVQKLKILHLRFNNHNITLIDIHWSNDAIYTGYATSPLRLRNVRPMD